MEPLVQKDIEIEENFNYFDVYFAAKRTKFWIPQYICYLYVENTRNYLQQ